MTCHLIPTHTIHAIVCVVAGAGLLGSAATTTAHTQVDAAAVLLNVTLRPGYDFANAGDALTYGHGICGKVSQGRSYAHVMGEGKADFSTSDEYRARHLISQAVNELCPAVIWHLRNSAAHYRPTLAGD